MKTVLLTGACGMIGAQLKEKLLTDGYKVVGIDLKNTETFRDNYVHIQLDLSDKEALTDVFEKYNPDRVIHLAALAHTAGENNLTYERYLNVNVVCSENLFDVAFSKNASVLYISTADVYGFVKGVVNADTELNPVSYYGKSKALAEQSLQKVFDGRQNSYTIFRFQPVYTATVKRDIQKRYYLKYPKWAYKIGSGAKFEVLSIENAVLNMRNWLNQEPKNDIRNIKDECLLDVNQAIAEEKAQGRAKHVIRVPRWIAVTVFAVVKFLTGKNKYTYLLNKAVNPLRTE